MKVLRSPNFWVGLTCIAGLAGIACVATGLLSSNESLTRAGLWLLGPLMLGGVLLVVAVIPILIWVNRRKPPQPPDSTPSPPSG